MKNVHHSSFIIHPLPIALFFSLIAITGYIGGRIHQSLRDIPTEPLQLIEDTRTKTPVVMIDAIYEGSIHGTTEGQVRIFGEGHMVVPDAKGNFRIALSSLRKTIDIRVPSDAKFAASKNGKKYYDITSKAAARLKPETRVYFRTAEDAERAGYTK